jgi:putative hemolysin
MDIPELSYARPSDPAWKRWIIHAVERVSGRRRLVPLYDIWRREHAGKHAFAWTKAVELVEARLDIVGPSWPPKVAPDTPLVMIANHPYGLGDGMAILALAEQLGRPFRVLINNDILRVPELVPYALPIDFSETPEAIKTNLATRAAAKRLLNEGVTIIIFPAGGVATAAWPWGKAEELPWKTFTARLIQLSRASVLPIYFEGQNGPLFHLVSQVSMTLRLSLLVSEFRRFLGGHIRVHAGDVVPFDALVHRDDRKALMQELYDRVHALAPGAPAPSTTTPVAALN